MKHLEIQIKDFGQQFTEQIKALESKVSVDSSILSNILDLYKRRATIEQDYADNLLKLNSSITQRNNLENLKRPKWKNYSPVKVLNSLLASTEHTARAHKNLSDIYGKQMTQRIMDMQDDCVRLTKRSTDILQRRHTEILKSVNQLLVKQKNYVKIFNEADDCRRRADKAMELLDREVVRCQDKKKEMEKNPKIKKLKDEYLEKYNAFKEKQIESTTARNKYIIHLVSLKDAVDHFYTNELNTIIQCSQYGFHNNLTRLSMNHGSCEEAMFTVHNSISKLFTTTIDHIDATNDKDVFFEAHKSIFTLKERLHFSPAKDDNINKIMKTEQKVENDLKNMHVKFDTEMKNISKYMVDRKFSIDVLSNSYNDLINQSDYDVVDYVCYQAQVEQSVKDKTTSLPRDSVNDNLYSFIQRKVKEPKLSKEAAYFKAMEEYLNDQINIVNISTKLKNVETVLSSPTDDYHNQSFHRIQNIHQQTAVMIGMKSKLFGGDLKKYSLETKEMVPQIVRSCIRLINIYGMRNIGVFRVPGSQVDIQKFQSQFELGCDPVNDLIGTTNDVNLAASLLKLYFRELDPPIFDEEMFTKIVDRYTVVKQKEEAIVEFLKEIVMTLDPSVYSTVLYLVSFVNHLSEFSHENCMDILNLAIIFGPCLMPIPEDQNCQLFHFQTIINHVAQCLITYHEQIFTKESYGPIYHRTQSSINAEQPTNLEPNLTLEPDKSPLLDDSLTSSIEEGVKNLPRRDRKSKTDSKNLKRNESTRYVRPRPMETQLAPRRNSDSERTKVLTAVAIADYSAKEEHEISFVNGDLILLKKKVNEQWWSGSLIKSKSPSVSGIIPNAYIRIISHDENTPDNEHSQVASKDSDVSPDIQRLSETKKISLVSVGSDDDLEFSSRDGISLNPSLGNYPDHSDTCDSKSLNSLDNIASMGSMDDIGKMDNGSCEKAEKESVKIRTGSLLRSSDVTEVSDLFDDDLRQTMQGLQKIEQLNVINHRSTVHIDKTLLASKFINPFRPEPLIFLAKDLKPRLSADDKPPVMSEFKIKKPGNVSSLASSFEMSLPTKPAPPALCPPPTFPKPKINKK